VFIAHLPAKASERSQGIEVNRGVDLGGLEAVMTQQLADLTERGTLAQRLGG
jgi:hypothetical protein